MDARSIIPHEAHLHPELNGTIEHIPNIIKFYMHESENLKEANKL
jgi:hypothetical protein